MTIEEGLFAFVTGDVDVHALIGSRMYALRLPQEPKPVFPAIVYQRVDGDRERAGDGPTHLATGTYTLTCWAGTYEMAKSLARLVRRTLDGAAGPFGDVEVGWVFAKDSSDDYEDDLKLYGRIVELTIQYAED